MDIIVGQLQKFGDDNLEKKGEMYITQLEMFVKRIKEVEIIYILGTGWIAKLYYSYLISINKIDSTKVKIIQIEENCLLEWDEVVTYKNMSNLEGLKIIAQKEDEAKQFLSKEKINDCEEILYLSEPLKNMIDEQLMKEYPELYEKRVLIGRKQELDEKMQVRVQSNLERLSKVGEIFQTIEIETINRCNGTCAFCPINKNDEVRTYKKMDEMLYEDIINQLSDIGYDGRISLFSNNEPLLDNRIVKFAEYAMKKLPKAMKIIFTNGTLLNMPLFQKLIPFLDLMCIDIYYDECIVDEISDDLKAVLKYCLGDKTLQKKIMVQSINRTAIRNNRGGSSKNRHEKYLVHAGCILPSIQMVVRPDGKVSLCCNDARGQITMGDVTKKSLLDVWNSNLYKETRNRIGETRQNYEFCKECDNFATLNSFGKEVFTEKQLETAWEQVSRILYDEL